MDREPGGRSACLPGLPIDRPAAATFERTALAGVNAAGAHPWLPLLAAADVLSMPQPAPSLQEAVDAVLAQPDLAAAGRRSYA